MPSAGFAHVMAGSLVWDNFLNHIENREIGGALALGGCRFINTYNNQSLVGAQGMGYIGEDMWPGQNMWGGQGPVVFLSNGVPKTKKNKITSWP